MYDNELKVLDLYTKASSTQLDSFNSTVQSTYLVDTNFEKGESDLSWLKLMEDTIMYIDNILRNPNRFIVNEEEVVLIEKARRVTVESIKHLAKNTSFIQKIEDNGDVKPSKILNINKDENYNTYENRVIYTLVRNMQMFVDMRERELVTNPYTKDSKKGEYHGSAKIGGENVNINVSLTTSINREGNYVKSNGMTVEERIAKLKLRILDLTNTEVFKTLKRANVAKVIPPIKKTNLILKNTNFQYAMKLWNYLQSYDSTIDSSRTKKNAKFHDDIRLKGMFDDVFLLNYLIVHSLGEQDLANKEANKELVQQITDSMITKIIEINADLPMEELQRVIGDKIAVIRNKKQASIEEIQGKLNSQIQSTLSKIVSFKFG
jgi:hypothetical protein